MKKGKWIFKWVLAGLLFLLVLGFVTMWLWNWLVPVLFNGPEISFLQAFGLLLLSKILFSGWGRNGCKNGGGAGWKKSYYDKLTSMTPEERERFKSRMREKWRCGEPVDKSANTGDSNV